jgi:undecaprenyl pyrophosphate phosphatase UppP
MVIDIAKELIIGFISAVIAYFASKFWTRIKAFFSGTPAQPIPQRTKTETKHGFYYALAFLVFGLTGFFVAPDNLWLNLSCIIITFLSLLSVCGLFEEALIHWDEKCVDRHIKANSNNKPD